MVVQEGVAAGGGDSLELVVGQPMAEVAAGGSEGVQETVAGILEAVGAEDGLETAFVEAGVVRHEGDIGRETVCLKCGQNAVFHLVPDVRKEWGVLCIVGSQAVDLLAEPGVVIRIGMYETVEGVHHFPIAYNDDSHGANAAGAAVSRFEVYDDCVVQNITNVRIFSKLRHSS